MRTGAGGAPQPPLVDGGDPQVFLLRALVSLVGILNARLARGQARSLPLGMVLGAAALLGALVLGWVTVSDAVEPSPAPMTIAEVAAGTSHRFLRITGTAVYQNGLVRKAGDQFQAYYYPVLDADSEHVLMVKSAYTLQGNPERVAVVGVLRPIDAQLLDAVNKSAPYSDVAVNSQWLLDTSYYRVPFKWGITGTIALVFAALVLLLGSFGAWTAFAPDELEGLAGIDPLAAPMPVRVIGWMYHETGMQLFVHLLPAMLVPQAACLSAQASISFTWYARANSPSYGGVWRLDFPLGERVRFGYVHEGFAQRPAIRWRSGKRRYAYLVFHSEREAAAALHALENAPAIA